MAQLIELGTAICSKCGVEHPLDGFYYWTSARDGKRCRHHECKKCFVARTSKNRRERVKPWSQSVVPKRPASIDCKFLCAVCGGGYEYTTQREADECCRIPKEE